MRKSTQFLFYLSLISSIFCIGGSATAAYDFVQTYLGKYEDNSARDRRDDWVVNEAGTSYDATLAVTTIQQYDLHGGDPIADEQLGQNFDEVNDNIAFQVILSFTLKPEITESVSPITVGKSDNTGSVNATEEALDENSENGDTELATAEENTSEDTTVTGNLTSGTGAIAVGFENHSNGIRYSTDVQKYDWNVTWSSEMDRYATITNEYSYSGGQSLKIAYPPDKQSNKGAIWMLQPKKEYYFSYWVKFDDDFDFDGDRASGGKLPGLGQGELCSGGMHCNGTNGFTSRYMWRENGQAVLYLYHMDKPDIWGEDLPLGRSFQRGQWHHMVQRVKVNDNGRANGEIEVWMDGNKVLTRLGVRLTNGQGIDTAYFSTFHGGSGSDWWPDKKDYAYFDDFVVSPNPADVGL